ncbi:hypothetical protein GE115_06625 [Agromyces sp. CFH 90414]|uniref:Uncharacterized protein n=1 Tax=Agromyces agglutinans TaxID=2662258 RepID=A0A6I2F701_9MICO|nr:hypothetical protein [Agromyces agglutinans]MRG59547.1 hypothetical protein [Agromyces agglutinans]
MTEEPLRRPRVRAADSQPTGWFAVARAAASSLAIRALRGVLGSRLLERTAAGVRQHRLAAFVGVAALTMVLAIGGAVMVLQSLSVRSVAEPDPVAVPRPLATTTPAPASYAPILPSPVPGGDLPTVPPGDETDPGGDPESGAVPEAEAEAEPEPTTQPEPDAQPGKVPPGHAKRTEKPGH